MPSIKNILKALEQFRISPSTATLKEIQPTFYEALFNSNEASRIIKRNSAAGGTDVTIYTVPQNYALYITTANIELSNTAVAGATGNLYLGSDEICRIHSESGNSPVSMPFSFAFPYVLKAGESVRIAASGAGAGAYGGFTGFLVKLPQI